MSLRIFGDIVELENKYKKFKRITCKNSLCYNFRVIDGHSYGTKLIELTAVRSILHTLLHKILHEKVQYVQVIGNSVLVVRHETNPQMIIYQITGNASRVLAFTDYNFYCKKLHVFVEIDNDNEWTFERVDFSSNKILYSFTMIVDEKYIGINEDYLITRDGKIVKIKEDEWFMNTYMYAKTFPNVEMESNAVFNVFTSGKVELGEKYADYSRVKEIYKNIDYTFVINIDGGKMLKISLHAILLLKSHFFNTLLLQIHENNGSIEELEPVFKSVFVYYSERLDVTNVFSTANSIEFCDRIDSLLLYEQLDAFRTKFRVENCFD